MQIEEKKKQFKQQLLSHYNNDVKRVKRLVKGCKDIGLPLGEEKTLDAIAEHPEAFFTLMTFSDFGVLEKIGESLTILKEE